MPNMHRNPTSGYFGESYSLIIPTSYVRIRLRKSKKILIVEVKKVIAQIVLKEKRLAIMIGTFFKSNFRPKKRLFIMKATFFRVKSEFIKTHFGW